MLDVKQHGDFKRFTEFLKNVQHVISIHTLDRFGKEGVAALAAATPVDTGKTASSWSYKIVQTKNSTTLSFHNSNIQNGTPIAVIIQYGHATRNGGWVEGRDYINPTVRPIFDRMAAVMWEEVKRA